MKSTFIVGLAILAIGFIACKQHTNQSKAPNEKEITSEIEQKTEKIHHYICYTNDDKSSRKIWIGFAENGKAISVKYEGISETIQLKFDKEDYIEGGAHPTIIQYYDEIYKGKVHGKYKLTHSGIWDYVEYTRESDAKKFNFTIDHDANPYSKEPCFE